jgi:hypothetical protein
MTDLRIVCTHDALKAAEALRRLLEAEQHKVTVSYGRQSLSELPKARAAKQHILLIWSYEAPTAQYMLDWARQIEPSHLIEIARAPGFPAMSGHAPVIDFEGWNGERGGPAWAALNERVESINPKPAPQKKKITRLRAAAALAGVSFAAISGALLMRTHVAPDPAVTTAAAPDVEPEQIAQQVDEIAPAPGDGVGGPLQAIEPPSIDYLYEVTPAPGMRVASISAAAHAELSVPDLDPRTRLREPTFFERLAEFNPLRRDDPAPPAPPH